MKKLGKLTLNEMTEFAPLSLDEQKNIKGGNVNYWRYVAWEVEMPSYKELVLGSGSTSEGATTLREDPFGISLYVSGSRSVEHHGVIQIYNSDLDIDTFGSRQPYF